VSDTSDPEQQLEVIDTPPDDPIPPIGRTGLPQLPTKFAGLQVYQPREVRQYKGYSLAISGRGGVGKTTLASTVVNSPIAHNCLFVDIEGGAVVIDDAEDRPGYVPEEGPHLGVVNVTTWGELNVVMQRLITDRKRYGINSAIFDNCSEALELSKIRHGFYTADKKDRLSLWDDITNDMVQLFRQGRDLARNEQFVMIFILWDTDRLMETGDPRSGHKRDLGVNPKSAEKLQGIMDYVAWLETPPKPKPPYPPIMHFEYDPEIPTKKRLNPKQQSMLGIPDLIYNPDMGDIVDTVLGGKPWPHDKHIDKPAVTKSFSQAMTQRTNNKEIS